MQRSFGLRAHSFCHFCGESLERSIPHDGGKKCVHCRSTIYFNPTPVGVLIIPCRAGGDEQEIIAIRRNIEPGKGKLALPGGYVLQGETWEQAAVREAHEEVGCVIRNTSFEWPTHFHTESTPDGNHVIIVGIARAYHLGEWKPNSEVMEVVRYYDGHPEQLYFPIHAHAVERYFQTHSGT